MKSIVALLAAVIFALSSCQKAPDILTYEVLSTRTHDPLAYTQGLQLSGGRMFESTGLYGQSSLRELDPATGEVLRNRPLAKTVFGEGLTLFNQQLWVLTWKEKTAYVFEPDTFKLITSYPFEGEGWGLTSDGSHLIMSDGTNVLKFMNPGNFTVMKSLEIMDGDRPVKLLNELEWIDGSIFANIYLTDRIARISPETGLVTGWLDLSGLRKQLGTGNRAEVLNGIAHDSKTGHLLVTGKHWPKMFEIKIGEK
jgi:glutaminyl-peptide cyclotransferase